MAKICLNRHRNIMFFQRETMLIIYIIHNLIQEKLLIVMIITNFIHWLHNAIRIQLYHFTTHKLKPTPTRIKNGIIIWYYNDISIIITLTTNNYTYWLRVPSWENKLRINIIIINIRCKIQLFKRRLIHTNIFITIFIQIMDMSLIHTKLHKISSYAFGIIFTEIDFQT